MPESRGFMNSFSEGLKQTVPLMLRKMQLDQAETHFNANLQAQKNKIMADAANVKIKIDADRETNRIDAEMQHALKLDEISAKAGFDESTARIKGDVDLEKLNVEDVKKSAAREDIQAHELEKQRLISSGKGTLSSVGKLIVERDALPETDPRRPFYDQAIQKAISQKGMVIESDGKGGMTIRTNADQNAGGLQKPVITDIQKKQVATSEGLARISQIVKSYRPEFQEIPTKLGVAWTDLKERLGAGITPDAKARLAEFSQFKQNALENINLYIKEITGAQMSEKEADRLRQAMPDSGEGIFDGDSPTEFKAKLTNQYKKMRSAAMRYTYYLNQGVGEQQLKGMINNGSVVSLEKMDEIINERGKAYEQQIKDKNPNIDAQGLFTQVKAALAKEFGVE